MSGEAAVVASAAAPDAGRLAGFREALRGLPRLPAAVVAVTLLVAVFAGALTPRDPLAINPIEGEKPPAFVAEGDWRYPLGTDRKGRDILSRVIRSLSAGWWAPGWASSPATAAAGSTRS
jgi:ABC-type dipeptide/oligopeptide/nickel transport system permease subunit